MNEKKNNLSRAFSRAHDNMPTPPKRQSKVPDMIRKDHPEPVPRPPGVGHEVNEDLFNQRWTREIETARQPKQFDNQQRVKLLNNAQVIKNSGLKLSDKFQRIEQRAKGRIKDRGRER